MATSVSGTWRTVAIGLIAGGAAYGVLSLRRPAVTVPTVVTVRELSAAVVDDDPRLSRALDVVDFQQTSLMDTIASLAKRGEINVVTDWYALDKDGEVGPGRRISLHLKGVHWSAAMDAVLFAVSPSRRLAWTMHEGTVYIGVAGSSALGDPIVRVYDIEPLVVQLRAVRSRVHQHPTTQGFAPNTSQHASLSTSDDDLELLDEVHRFIEQSVDPSSWLDSGGDVGTISSFGPLLIITQTEQNQQRVAAALHLLAERH